MAAMLVTGQLGCLPQVPADWSPAPLTGLINGGGWPVSWCYLPGYSTRDNGLRDGPSA